MLKNHPYKLFTEKTEGMKTSDPLSTSKEYRPEREKTFFFDRTGRKDVQAML